MSNTCYSFTSKCVSVILLSEAILWWAGFLFVCVFCFCFFHYSSVIYEVYLSRVVSTIKIAFKVDQTCQDQNLPLPDSI